MNNQGQDKNEQLPKDYERPEDRIPHQGKGLDTQPGEARAASNQQHDMGPVSKPERKPKL